MYITTLYYTEVEPVRCTVCIYISLGYFEAIHAAAPFDWPVIAPAPSYAWPRRISGSSCQSLSFPIMLFAIASPVSPVSQARKQRNRSQEHHLHLQNEC